MTNSMIPYSFTPGTKAKAQEVNANFVALADKIDENNATAMHYNSSATISGDMTFTKPIISSGAFSVSQGNLTVKNLTNGASTDAVIAINSDTNKRCGSVRFVNGSGYNDVSITAANESGDIQAIGIRNTNGSVYAYCPTYTANYADSSTKIVTTAYMANHWVTSKPTTSSTASKARPTVVIQNYLSGTNGAVKFSDGLIMQWGTFNPTSANVAVTITYKLPFSNANYSLSCTRISTRNNNSSFDRENMPNSKNSTGFTIWSNTGINLVASNWFAIGY